MSAAKLRARTIVWISVVVPAALALSVVLRCGHQYPYSDDWDLVVPILSGEHSLTFSWLWAQHNEHRLPLVRLILIVFDALFGGDFRGGVLASWIMLLAIAMMLYGSLAKSKEAAPLWSALLFAVIVLNPSNNALRWGVEIQFVTSATLMVASMLAAHHGPSTKSVLVSGLSATLLPLTGGNGVLFAFAAIAATGYLSLRTSDTKQRAIGACLVAITVLEVGYYFVGYRSPPNHEGLATHALSSVVIVIVHLVVAPFGPYASRLLPATGPLAVFGLAAAFFILWRRYRADRSLSSVMVASAITLGGSLLVFAAIAFGRGARGWPAGLETHYASLGIPLWAIVCVALLTVGSRALPAAVCAAQIAAFITALPLGPRPPYVALGKAFRADLCAGVASPLLAERHIDLLYYVDTPQARATVASHLDALRAKSLAAWRCDR